jgi:uncharacterized protein (DUF1330 family)
MKTAVNVIFLMLAGIAIGSVGVQVLEAQIRPSAYVIAEADVTDRDAYNREYLPLLRKLLMDRGGKYLAGGGAKIVPVDGEPPRAVAIIAFENLDKAQAVLTSAAFSDARAIGRKYANFRAFVVEGLRRAGDGRDARTAPRARTR